MRERAVVYLCCLAISVLGGVVSWVISRWLLKHDDYFGDGVRK